MDMYSGKTKGSLLGSGNPDDQREKTPVGEKNAFGMSTLRLMTIAVCVLSLKM